jgi:flagellar biosynthetic protein FlhB
MAGSDDKTEAPTAKRRGEARDKGQVARSPDLNGAGVLMVGIVVISLVGGKVVNDVAGAMTSIFGDIARPHNSVSGAGLHGLETLVETTLAKTLGPIAGACIGAGLLINLLQVGIRFTPHALRPSFAALNPITGIKNLFSPRTTVNLVKDLAKVTVIGGLVALVLIPDITHPVANVGTTPYDLGLLMRAGVKSIAMRAVLAYLLIGLADFAYQRHRFEKGLKMTKQAVREENKQKDLPPEVRRALKKRQFQLSRARMMAAVPRADVVVTNPTHYAVALEYDGEHPAPIVIAKGKDHIAAQIRRIAEENNIPLVPNPPLARDLYRSVEVDQMIPADLYAAVAQVLAYVYRMAARKKVSV